MMHRLSKRNRYARIIDFIYEKLREKGASTSHDMRQWMFEENNRNLDILPNALGNVLARNKSKFRKVGKRAGCFLWEAVEGEEVTE